MFRSVSAGESMSSGSMAKTPENSQILVGTWKCDVTLPAMAGQKGFTHHLTMTISLAPNMTLHIHFAVKQFMSEAYIGTDMKSKLHWLTSTSTAGEVISQTSNDGMVYAGTSWYEGQGIPIRGTFARISDTILRDVTELQEQGKWTQNSEAVCTKT